MSNQLLAISYFTALLYNAYMHTSHKEFHPYMKTSILIKSPQNNIFSEMNTFQAKKKMNQLFLSINAHIRRFFHRNRETSLHSEQI